MNRYEYKIEYIDFYDFEEKLNSFGEEGWEVFQIEDNSNTLQTFGKKTLQKVFMRRKIEKESLNAKVRNKLTPFRTLMDISEQLCNDNFDVIKYQTLITNILKECEKSIDFLKNIDAYNEYL